MKITRAQFRFKPYKFITYTAGLENKNYHFIQWFGFQIEYRSYGTHWDKKGLNKWWVKSLKGTNK